MLYDNILFVNLLGQFYLEEPNDYYKDKLIQTVEFVNKALESYEDCDRSFPDNYNYGGTK